MKRISVHYEPIYVLYIMFKIFGFSEPGYSELWLFTNHAALVWLEYPSSSNELGMKMLHAL